MDDTKKVLLVDGGDIDKKLKLATQNLHYVNALPSIVSLVISAVAFRAIN
jgi:large subunit ribosomal protein L4